MGVTAPQARRAVIRVQGLRKAYGSHVAVADASFEVLEGEIFGLVGPNGAGKTTLMRCIADGAERSAGSIRINDRDVGRRPPHQCVALGVGRKFQAANVFDTLTVAEALRMARTRLRRPRFSGRDSVLAVPSAVLKVLETTGLDQKLDLEVRHLSHGQKQALELAMVLTLEPSVVLLDEPTAGLTKPERALIGQILIELTAREGLCILLVEHDLDFVREISSRVIVLHQGQIVLDGTVAEVVGSELVRNIYAGGGSMNGAGAH